MLEPPLVSDEECSEGIPENEDGVYSEVATQAEQLCYRYLYASLKEWKSMPKNANLSVGIYIHITNYLLCEKNNIKQNIVHLEIKVTKESISHTR